MIIVIIPVALAGLAVGQEGDPLLDVMDPEFYCQGRSDDEFFRREIFPEDDEKYVSNNNF